MYCWSNKKTYRAAKGELVPDWNSQKVASTPKALFACGCGGDHPSRPAGGRSEREETKKQCFCYLKLLSVRLAQ